MMWWCHTKLRTRNIRVLSAQVVTHYVILWLISPNAFLFKFWSCDEHAKGRKGYTTHENWPKSASNPAWVLHFLCELLHVCSNIYVFLFWRLFPNCLLNFFCNAGLLDFLNMDAYILKADVLDVRTPQKIQIFRRKIFWQRENYKSQSLKANNSAMCYK